MPDLAALWLIAHGDNGGLSMLTAMLPVWAWPP
jgi:hypothetical protein